MQRDKALNIFLFFVLASVIFVAFFPVYFSFGEAHLRVVALSERLFSLVFVSLWMVLSVYAAWKKKLYLVLGGAAYAIMAYIPGWILPSLPDVGVGQKDPSLLIVSVRFIFEKIYELVNAPMVGVSILFAEKQSVSLSKWLLPVLLISYASAQIFRHYRNAYLAEQLHLEDTAYYPNPDLARELASVTGTERVQVYASKELARKSREIEDDLEREALSVPGKRDAGKTPTESTDNRESASSSLRTDEERRSIDVISLEAPDRSESSDHDGIITLGPPAAAKGDDTANDTVTPAKSDFDIGIRTDSEDIGETRRFNPPRSE